MAEAFKLKIFRTMLIYASIYTITLATNGDTNTSNCCVIASPGIPGNNGVPGNAGAVGQKGELGSKGDGGGIGNTGAVGLVGPVGKKGEDGLPGPIGLPGKRGEHGITGIQGLDGQRGPLGKKGNKGGKGERSVKSAFSVAFKNDPGHADTSIPLKYDHVITNVGNNYNVSSGKFVCHHSGTYVFQVTMLKDNSSNSASVYIAKNAQSVVTVITKDYNNNANNMVVLTLMAGDEVWTQPSDINSNNFFSNNKAFFTFSGFLIYAE